MNFNAIISKVEVIYFVIIMALCAVLSFNSFMIG